MGKKVIYLKTLLRKSKEDKSIISMIDDAIFEANGITSERLREKTKERRKCSRDFILENTEDFLAYALDYSFQNMGDEIIW